MLKSFRKWLILGMLLFLFANITASGRQTKWPCDKSCTLLKNAHGKYIWFGSAALKRRATHTVTPQTPLRGCANATIVVEVLIDNEGNVQCLRTLKGHPFLRRAAEEAAQQWKFKPIESKGQKVAVLGRLMFRFTC